MTFSAPGTNSTDSVLQPQSLKIVTFWHFCVKVQCRGFQKAFVAFLAAGYCFIPRASTVEGQVCELGGGAMVLLYIQDQRSENRKPKKKKMQILASFLCTSIG